MKEDLFTNWLLLNNRPLRYSKTIINITKDLKKEGYPLSDIYSIEDSKEVKKIKSDYLNFKRLFEKNKRGKNMYNSALNRYIDFLEENESIYQLIEEVNNDKKIKKTEKKNLIKVRLGQSEFRKRLICYWKGCSVTRTQMYDILIASHIKPWNISTNDERIDLFNGLLLTPNLDKLFDKGYITFNDNGEILISSFLKNYQVLGVSKDMRINITDSHKKYLKYHRNNIFLNCFF